MHFVRAPMMPPIVILEKLEDQTGIHSYFALTTNKVLSVESQKVDWLLAASLLVQMWSLIRSVLGSYTWRTP